MEEIPKKIFLQIYSQNDVFIHDILHLTMIMEDNNLFQEMFKYVTMDVFNYDLLSPPPYFLTYAITTKNKKIIETILNVQHVKMRTSYIENIYKADNDLLVYADKIGGEKLRDFLFHNYEPENLLFLDKKHDTSIHNFMMMERLDEEFIIRMIKKAPKDVFNIKGSLKMTLMELGQHIGNENIIKRLKKAGADQYWAITGN